MPHLSQTNQQHGTPSPSPRIARQNKLKARAARRRAEGKQEKARTATRGGTRAEGNERSETAVPETARTDEKRGSTGKGRAGAARTDPQVADGHVAVSTHEGHRQRKGARQEQKKPRKPRGLQRRACNDVQKQGQETSRLSTPCQSTVSSHEKKQENQKNKRPRHRYAGPTRLMAQRQR